jgi:hypothetical protein
VVEAKGQGSGELRVKRLGSDFIRVEHLKSRI